MELDDLKHAWQTLDHRLQQSHALQLQIHRDRKLDTLRQRLRPLAWGQALQMIAGVLIVLLAVSFWPAHRQEPHLLLTGLVVHVYGIALIALGGVMQFRLGRIDYSAPVLDIQKQLAALRRLYVLGGMWVGLPWWWLWVPFMMVFFEVLFGADLYRNAPSVIWIGLATGMLGMLGTWWLHRRARDPRRPRLAKFLDESLTGKSLRHAEGILDELSRFEQG